MKRNCEKGIYFYFVKVVVSTFEEKLSLHIHSTKACWMLFSTITRTDLVLTTYLPKHIPAALSVVVFILKVEKWFFWCIYFSKLSIWYNLNHIFQDSWNICDGKLCIRFVEIFVDLFLCGIFASLVMTLRITSQCCTYNQARSNGFYLFHHRICTTRTATAPVSSSLAWWTSLNSTWNLKETTKESSVSGYWTKSSPTSMR